MEKHFFPFRTASTTLSTFMNVLSKNKGLMSFYFPHISFAVMLSWRFCKASSSLMASTRLILEFWKKILKIFVHIENSIDFKKFVIFMFCYRSWLWYCLCLTAYPNHGPSFILALRASFYGWACFQNLIVISLVHDSNSDWFKRIFPRDISDLC